MTYGKGEYLINLFGRDWAKAKAAQEEWRLFQFCLRNTQLHPTCALVNNGFSRRTSIRWCSEFDQWGLFLTVREGKQARWENAQILHDTD